MPAYVNGDRRDLAVLLRDLAEGSAELVRTQIRLAQLEVEEVVAGIARGTALMAMAATLFVLGSLALLSGLILLIGDQWISGDRYWLAALMVLVVAGIIAGWFAKRGMALLSPSKLVPATTVATLQEDKEWLKRQLTSGATSS